MTQYQQKLDGGDCADSEVAALSGMEALGTLALLWQVPDGPRGLLRHPIQVKPLQVGMGWLAKIRVGFWRIFWVEGTMESKKKL